MKFIHFDISANGKKNKTLTFRRKYRNHVKTVDFRKSAITSPKNELPGRKIENIFLMKPEE